MPRQTQDLPLNRLDPRSPLVLDTRALARRAGSIRRLSRTVAAPADLGIAVLGVPAGAQVLLELRLESVVEGVLVSGSARARLVGECVRCLDPLERALDVEFQELYAYPDVEREPADEAEQLRLEGALLDLEPALRDAVVLALPLAPLCHEDCPGLCVECGARLADEPGHAHEVLDGRWAALRALRERTSQTSTTRPTDPTEES